MLLIKLLLMSIQSFVSSNPSRRAFGMTFFGVDVDLACIIDLLMFYAFCYEGVSPGPLLSGPGLRFVSSNGPMP
jgi:hypothetical protein